MSSLRSFVVLYREAGVPYWDAPLAFLCWADDGDHAEEQALDAYPGCDIVWVHEGIRLSDAYAAWGDAL